MKDDQVVRSVAAVMMVALYAFYSVMNGSGPIRSGIPGLGEVHPFALAAVLVLVLALPETIDMLPWGPTREK